MKPGPRRPRPDLPIPITALGPSLDDQHEARKRKYLIMMGLRIVCVIAAAATYTTSLWLALALMVGGAVLPWCAVLIANDRPPKQQTGFVRFQVPAPERALESGRAGDGRSGPSSDSRPGPPSGYHADFEGRIAADLQDHAHGGPDEPIGPRR